MEKPHVYLMPGLGFDERIFYNLQFENAVPHYLKWEEPQINESLANYVKRISEQINNTKPFILIGHSFGGIIVQEISKIITTEKV
ncbi:MAG: hypothetical protein OQJ81_08815, partial [Melioribacteraceae bacterium]|nr:hypothetical protein [Melioribacteraceae bacterium]